MRVVLGDFKGYLWGTLRVSSTMIGPRSAGKCALMEGGRTLEDRVIGHVGPIVGRHVLPEWMVL